MRGSRARARRRTFPGRRALQLACVILLHPVELANIVEHGAPETSGATFTHGDATSVAWNGIYCPVDVIRGPPRPLPHLHCHFLSLSNSDVRLAYVPPTTAFSNSSSFGWWCGRLRARVGSRGRRPRERVWRHRILAVRRTTIHPRTASPLAPRGRRRRRLRRRSRRLGGHRHVLGHLQHVPGRLRRLEFGLHQSRVQTLHCPLQLHLPAPQRRQLRR